MLHIIYRIVLTFVGFVLIFAVQKPIFIAFYASLYPMVDFSLLWNVVRHGLPMDFSIAGYLTVIPGIIATVSCYKTGKLPGVLLRIYFYIISLILALIIISDLVLYRYWGFRLDSTPLFYFISSPKSAMASATSWQLVLGIVAVVFMTFIFSRFMLLITHLTPIPQTKTTKERITSVVTGGLFTLLLFIPIRGGVTVSTMNLSSAYFSTDQRINHAAINPVFSLLYSATHQSEFGSMYQFLDADIANTEFESLSPKESHLITPDSTLLTLDRPDICLVILESFSSHLMPSMGGDSIAVRLDSLSKEGILFTRFFANSFRTDRALPAILSGWPGQPSTSIMKYARKVEHLPSFPRRLGEAGYNLSYYYGGDIHFTNMLAYLKSSGFDTIIRDTDFPLFQRTSKWGAHDDLLFKRALKDMNSYDDPTPRLTVIQTSSSHEPFEVPFTKVGMPSPQANAFAYTDSCLGAFVDSIKASGKWDRTLMVIVPDHYGAWPKNLDTVYDRHHVPLVMCGGALRHYNVTDSLTASQTDIAATILGALGLSHDEFEFSNNLFDPQARRQAFLADPSVVTLINDSVRISWNCDAQQIVDFQTTDTVNALRQVQAYLQILYQRIDNL